MQPPLHFTTELGRVGGNDAASSSAPKVVKEKGGRQSVFQRNTELPPPPDTPTEAREHGQGTARRSPTTTGHHAVQRQQPRPADARVSPLPPQRPGRPLHGRTPPTAVPQQRPTHAQGMSSQPRSGRSHTPRTSAIAARAWRCAGRPTHPRMAPPGHEPRDVTFVGHCSLLPPAALEG